MYFAVVALSIRACQIISCFYLGNKSIGFHSQAELFELGPEPID